MENSTQLGNESVSGLHVCSLSLSHCFITYIAENGSSCIKLLSVGIIDIHLCAHHSSFSSSFLSFHVRNRENTYYLYSQALNTPASDDGCHLLASLWVSETIP